MAETLYAWLLRFYPVEFREAYGEDALQLFRDRARDERGLFAALRLWLDLLRDFVVSVPLVHRYMQPALAGASARRRLSGAPSFLILEGESPGLGAFVVGGVLSLTVLSGIAVLNSQVRGSHRRHAPLIQSASTSSAGSSAFQSSALAAQPPARPAVELASLPAYSPTQRPGSLSPTDASVHMVVKAVMLDPAERQRVTDAVIENLQKSYAYPDVAKKLSDALLAFEKTGDDVEATDGATFAGLLTRYLREISHDMHLIVVYSDAPLPDHASGPSLAAMANYRKALAQENCTFEKEEILPHNIGYVKFNSFPEPATCMATATTAMANLNQSDAIIFDLRDNRGGDPRMVSTIAAYLFDHPEYMYNPRENPTEQSWTQPVPGSRLADKPVYILTSSMTFSGAEQFSYDLKMLKRATLVGETTGGGAHAAVFHRIDDHFGVGITETKAVNPFATADWEGTGVEPDVKVKASDALETAERLAESRLKSNKAKYVLPPETKSPGVNRGFF